MQNIKSIAKLSGKPVYRFIASAFLAIFWVAFLWNFWDRGVYALGFNTTIFGLAFLGLFTAVLYEKKHYAKQDLFWIIPFILIFLSYSIYDNPFLKIINFLVLPAMFALFYNQAFLSDKKHTLWGVEFIFRIIGRFFSFFTKIGETARLCLKFTMPSGKAKKTVAIRIIGGVVLFLVIALTVFIPLLSSADAVFAGKVQVIYDWYLNIFSSVFVYKILTATGLTVLFFSILNAWSEKFNYDKKEAGEQKIDSIVSGIVLGGILGLYLLFLWIQIGHLWVGALPFDFKETENLVKSGFWQLLFLSIINILIYFFTYRKTALWTQKILMAFTFASLLLLISAGYRMALYAIYYGFSYEKFFASYTVIYCAVLFVWLIARLFIKQRANVLKFVITLFLWMYAMATILPIEQFVLRANVALSDMAGSKIRLPELTMLSPDVLKLAKEYKNSGLLKDENLEWSQWIIRNEKIVKNKVWYEKNLMNIGE